jgi:hypothetical protein
MTCPNCQRELDLPHHVCGWCDCPTDPAAYTRWLLRDKRDRHKRERELSFYKGTEEGARLERERRVKEDSCHA